MSLNLFTENKSMKLVLGLRLGVFLPGESYAVLGRVVLTGSFAVVQFSDDARDVYTKKAANEIAGEGNCRQFSQGASV